MDDQILAVWHGFKATVLENRAFKKLYLGAQAIGKSFVWLLGLTPAYFLMMTLSVLGGLINFYIVLETNSPGGIQLIAGNSLSAQIAFCIGSIIYGAIVGYVKRFELLAVGAVVWGYYALLVALATLSGDIIPQGWLATLYIVVGIVAMAGRVVEQARKEAWKKKYEESLATYEAYRKQVNHGQSSVGLPEA